MSGDRTRTPIAAGFYSLGGHNGSKHLRMPKDGVDELELDSGQDAHVIVYDDGTAEIDFQTETDA